LGERGLLKRTVSGITLTLLLIGMLTSTFNIQPVKGSGTIYIRADGSIDPPTAPISTSDNVTYTLTDNITCSGDGIIVERSNIVIDGNGYTLQGSGNGSGISSVLPPLNSLRLTVENIEIRNFSRGIFLWAFDSLYCSIFLCKIMDNGGGIHLNSWMTLFNISANKIANNNGTGIWIGDCEGYIRGNDIMNNGGDGIYAVDATCYISGNNITSNAGNGIFIALGGGGEIIENNIVANNCSGIELDSFINRIYHNTFKNNTKQVTGLSINTWDDGYPSGGNYWSDYSGVDSYSGLYQNETGSDNIGDSPYVIDGNNRDSYPLMRPYVPFENQTIYIRADGSMDPSGAPVHRQGNTYTLTGNITSDTDGIIVERDNIVIDGNGCTVQGSGSGNGVYWSDIDNVTAKNVEIKAFYCGIYIQYQSYYNSITENKIIANNGEGIYLRSCNASISGNDITNNGGGIYLEGLSGGYISGNNIVSNGGFGVCLDASGASVSGNNITNNEYGIGVGECVGSITGNSIASNGVGIHLWMCSVNICGNDITNNEYGIYHSSESYSDISGNNITNNEYGIYHSSESYSDISGNNITNNDYGIWSEFSGDTIISENNITNNGYGIYLIDSYASVSGNNITNNGYGIYLIDSYASVSGNNITNNGYGIYDIWYTSESWGEIIGNNITANNEAGIYIQASDGDISGNNIVANNGYGIILEFFSRGNNVSGNNITNNGCGICLAEANSNSISGNNIINNSGGISVGDSGGNNVSGNNITNNDYGMSLGHGACGNNISGNNITNNGFGISLYDSLLNSIDGNNITNNSYGVSLSESYDNNISGNNITNNGYGVRVSDKYSYGNRIYHNNFVNNTYQVDIYQEEFYANFWDDGYPSGGNYWSDYAGDDLYSGPDQDVLGGDGIGDTSYVIDANNTDNFPLMKPYPWDLHDIGITNIGKVYFKVQIPPIVPLKTVVGLGFVLHFNVFVMNYGTYPEVFNVTAYANTTVIDTITNISVAGIDSIILNFTWNTTSFAKGNYTISAYATPVPGETDTTDNTKEDGMVLVTIPGDVNGDYIVDGQDYQLVRNALPSMPGSPNWNPNADLNDDGVVDGQDFQLVKSFIGTTAP
jgi:parallel beta-helix repeat protein